MLLKAETIKSRHFITSEIITLIVLVACMAVFPEIWLLFPILAIITSGGIAGMYLLIEQRKEIAALKEALALTRIKEDEYIVRTEQLRRVLHDIRSPMSALKLRLQLLQKTSCEPDKKHLGRLEESLEAALEQVQMIGDIQKGKIAPTDTMQIKLETIRSYLNK